MVTNKSKYIAGIITVAIISILIISGPAFALIIGINETDSNNLKEFTVNINPNSGDKLPVTDLKVSIDNGPECHFDINGKLIDSQVCNSIGIVSINRINSTDKPGNGPKQGFGYGYDNSNNDRLSYKIIVDSTKLVPGTYDFIFSIKIGNGNKYHVEEKSFVINSTSNPGDDKNKDKDKNNNKENNGNNNNQNPNSGKNNSGKKK